MNKSISLLTATLLLAALPGCRHTRSARDLSVFPEPSAQQKIHGIYHDYLEQWPVSFDSMHVATRYGPTFVMVSGPDNGKALLLMHGYLIHSGMWLYQIETLSRHFRVYAVDAPGDVGKSMLTDIKHYPRTPRDVAIWAEEVMNELAIETASMIGTSQGAWRTLSCALHCPERLDRIVCIVPVGINSSLSMIMRLQRSMAWKSPEEQVDAFFELLGNESVRTGSVGNHYRTAFLSAQPRVPPVTRFTRKELEQIQSPALFLFAENDPFAGDPYSAARRVEMFVPECRYEIFPKTGHTLQTEIPETVNKRIVAFLEE